MQKQCILIAERFDKASLSDNPHKTQKGSEEMMNWSGNSPEYLFIYAAVLQQVRIWLEVINQNQVLALI